MTRDVGEAGRPEAPAGKEGEPEAENARGRIRNAAKAFESTLAGLPGRTERRDRGNEWVAELARAGSRLLRETVFGDRDGADAGLPNGKFLEQAGVRFDRLRPATRKRRRIAIGIPAPDGPVALQEPDAGQGPDGKRASVALAPLAVNVEIEWPLPGMENWMPAPAADREWTIAPDALFETGGKAGLDREGWLDQRLLTFDGRDVVLGDAIRLAMGEQSAGGSGARGGNSHDPFRTGGRETAPARPRLPERRILGGLAVHGARYTHIVLIQCALHLLQKLADAGIVEPSGAERQWPGLASGTAGGEGIFGAGQDWLTIQGSGIRAFGARGQTPVHRIRAIRPGE